MKRSVVYVTLLVVIAVLAVTTAQGAVPRGETLNSTISVEKWRHDLNDEIAINFSLTNTSNLPVSLLRWQTPIKGIETDLFEVTCDGEQVPYIGKLIKRLAPRPQDYLHLQPGESVQAVFDLSAAYDMTHRGTYAIRYRVAIESVATIDGAQRVAPQKPETPEIAVEEMEVASNAIEIYVDGMDTFEMATPEGPERVVGGFYSCSNTRQTTLRTAHANALSISQKASNYLTTYGNSTAYKTWFGTYTSSRFNTVKSHYTSLISTYNTKSVTFDCSCTDDYYAYVYANQPYRIYLCNAFWSAPALGIDSKAGTLVHETTHFKVVVGTSDYVYGTTGAQNLAKTNPSKAIMNADNHEYFAETR